MQIVILAGGLGTRLKPLTNHIPKCMIAFKGKPFLEYQIQLLKKAGILDFVVCVGFLGEQIVDYFGDGARLGVNITYSIEGEELLGTAGALKKAESILRKNFLITYGDSYLKLPYREIYETHVKNKSEATMIIHKNHNYFDQSNIDINNKRITFYDINKTKKDLVYIDAGLTVLNKEVLSLVPASTKYNLGSLFVELINKEKLFYYITDQRFYEIGSFSGQKEFRTLIDREDL